MASFKEMFGSRWRHSESRCHQERGGVGSEGVAHCLDAPRPALHADAHHRDLWKEQPRVRECSGMFSRGHEHVLESYGRLWGTLQGSRTLLPGPHCTQPHTTGTRAGCGVWGLGSGMCLGVGGWGVGVGGRGSRIRSRMTVSGSVQLSI